MRERNMQFVNENGFPFVPVKMKFEWATRRGIENQKINDTLFSIHDLDLFHKPSKWAEKRIFIASSTKTGPE